MPIDKSLAELTKLAATLEQESEDLNALIESLEKQLEGCKIGVSVWLDEVLEEECTVEARDARMVTVHEGWVIGYARAADAWRIAAKRCRATVTEEEGDAPDSTVWSDVTAPITLADAPRTVRVEAATLFEALLEALRHRVQQSIESIQKAKKLVAK